jgi:hypothetical protein
LFSDTLPPDVTAARVGTDSNGGPQFLLQWQSQTLLNPVTFSLPSPSNVLGYAIAKNTALINPFNAPKVASWERRQFVGQDDTVFTTGTVVGAGEFKDLGNGRVGFIQNLAIRRLQRGT